jgi:hypothetical protein
LAVTNGSTARNIQINLAEILSRAQGVQTGQAEQARGGRGAVYHATLLRDTNEPGALKVEHLTVSSRDTLSVDLRSGGGFVAMLQK